MLFTVTSEYPESVQAPAPVAVKESNGQRVVQSVLLIVLLSVIFALTCWISPMAGEDYGLSIPLGHRHRPAAMLEIGQRSLGQIKHWNARFGEQLAIIWVNCPKSLFVIAETLSFLALTFIITAIALRSITVDHRFVRLWSVSVCLFYLLWPRYETLFWVTGGSEYLQPLALTMTVLLPFILDQARQSMLSSKQGYCAMLVGAVFAGASFENAGPALLLYMTVTIFVRIRRQEPVRRLWSLLLAYAVGWTLLIAAPSTALRAKYYRQVLHTPPLSVHSLMQRIVEVFRVSTKTHALLIVGLGGLSLVMLLRQQERPYLRRKDWLLLLTGFIPAAIVVAAPYTEPRAFQLLSLVLLVMILRFALQVQRTPWVQRWIRWGLASAAVLFAMGVFTLYYEFALRVAARTSATVIASRTSQCETGIPFPLIETEISNRVLNNREVWVERSSDQVETYFGCRLVIVRGQPITWTLFPQVSTW